MTEVSGLHSLGSQSSDYRGPSVSSPFVQVECKVFALSGPGRFHARCPAPLQLCAPASEQTSGVPSSSCSVPPCPPGSFRSSPRNQPGHSPFCRPPGPSLAHRGEPRLLRQPSGPHPVTSLSPALVHPQFLDTAVELGVGGQAAEARGPRTLQRPMGFRIQLQEWGG